MQSLLSSSVTTGTGAGGAMEQPPFAAPTPEGREGREGRGKAPEGVPAGVLAQELLSLCPLPLLPGLVRPGKQLAALQARLRLVLCKALGSPRGQRKGWRDTPILILILILIPIPISISIHSHPQPPSALPSSPGTRQHGSLEPLPGNASSPRSSSCFCRALLAR